MALLAWLAASTASAQFGLDASGAVLQFPGFGATGFAPTPTGTQLDSDVWMPFGIDGVPGFGGTCTTGACARGMVGGILSGLAPGVWAVGPIAGFVATPGIGMQSGALGGGTFRPGGVRFRFVNSGSVPLRSAVVTARWASSTTIARNDVRVRFLPSCDTTAMPVPLVLAPASVTTGAVWTTFVDGYAPFDVNVPPGGLGCFEVVVGGGGSGVTLGLSALFELDIEFPAAICHDDVIETGEECESPAGSTRGPCECDERCRIPDGDPCDAGGGPCFGACEAGRCSPVARTDVDAVPGCDDGTFCNGLERCVSGVCTALADTGCPFSVCTFCDEATDTCAVPILGCCASGDECTGPCATGVCVANVCEVDPACGDAGPVDANTTFSDAASEPDASVEPVDGATTIDAAVTRPDASESDGGARADSGSSALDAGSTTVAMGNGFGGGGGCRCAAAGTLTSSWGLASGEPAAASARPM